MMLDITHAQGSWLYDTGQKKYLDLISGIAVSNIGHANKQVQKAIIQQLKKHTHLMVYGEYIQSSQVSFAHKLVQLLPASLQSVYFVNSGSEAIEGAMKLAKKYTGRHQIISAKKSYHGSTHGALSLQSENYFTNAYRPLLPGIKHFNFNDVSSLSVIDEQTACVILEPVQAEAGIIVPDPNFLQALRKKCTETGALLVFDEIQTGFGRTGALFAFEKYGIIPDILVLGKALGGGLPLGAFISCQEIMQSFVDQPVLGHITTFGGHPLSCAAGKASLSYLLEKKLISLVETKRRRFLKHLQNLSNMELRNIGLLFAVDLGSPELMRKVVAYCLEEGLIVDWFLFNEQSIRLCPPLTIKKKEIDFACEVLTHGIKKYC